jgi:2-polyprenyl-3-methyl-5-hydroxy-6-metoxy-1,4-benzoquinol methylase
VEVKTDAAAPLSPVRDFYEAKYSAGEEIQRTSKQYTLDCIPADGTVLEIIDIGCGTGHNSRAMVAKGHRVRGIDISEHAIARYRENGFDGRTMDIERGLEFADASFDLAFCSEVIEHLVRPERFAAEVYRVLRPGGRLVLSTPNSAFWLYRILALFGWVVSDVQHPMHLRFFTRASLRRLLETAGFRTRATLGRNMYLILPDPRWKSLRGAFRALGLQEETRFVTRKSFWHVSSRSIYANGIFADTLICVMEKPNAAESTQ